MYIDFAGDSLKLVDEMTGETKKAGGICRPPFRSAIIT